MRKHLPDYYERTSIRLWPNGDFSPAGLFSENTAKSLDIRNIVSNITIRESLLDSSIQIALDVMDGNNILEDLKIEGDEYITLEFQKKTPEGKRAYKLKCLISDIINLNKPGPGVQTYQLLCVSEHAYINELTMLDRKFEGNIGTLVKNILKKDLAINPLYIGKINTKTSKNIKGVYPQLRPLNAIRWLMRNAFENSTPFFFYEGISPGFRNQVHFTSLDDLSKRDIVAEFERKPFNIGPNVGAKPKAIEIQRRKQILKVAVPEVKNMLEHISDGAFGSVMTHFDIATKTIVSDNEYRYDGKFVLSNEIAGNKSKQFKPIGNHVKFKGKTLADFPYARKFYSSQNSLSFAGTPYGNYHSPIPENLRKGIQKQYCMETSKLQIDINGDPRLKVGDKIEVKIGKAMDTRELKGSKPIDESVSGVYMIYGMHHILDANESWQSTLDLRKDSSNIDYDIKVTRVKGK